MELAELRAAYRLRADDNASPPHVEDEDVARFASEGEREACIRARLIFDDTTASVTTYAIAAGQTIVPLHEAIDVIAAAYFQQQGSTRRKPVDLQGLDWIKSQADWATRTSSKPCALAHPNRTQARLWPAPTVAGTLYLEVYRLPLFALDDDDDEPEIDSDHHDGLVDWILYRAYSIKDSEMEDPKRASLALATFEERFGERPDADSRRRQRERRRVTTGCL